jgi:hypothetical protein
MTVKRVLIVASLAMIACFLASSASAADQPIGTGAPTQQEMKKDQPQISRDAPAPGEVGKGQERQMKLPEWIKIAPDDDYSHLLNLDFHGQDQGVVGRTKEEDELAVSF